GVRLPPRLFHHVARPGCSVLRHHHGKILDDLFCLPVHVRRAHPKVKQQIQGWLTSLSEPRIRSVWTVIFAVRLSYESPLRFYAQFQSVRLPQGWWIEWKVVGIGSTREPRS